MRIPKLATGTHWSSMEVHQGSCEITYLPLCLLLVNAEIPNAERNCNADDVDRASDAHARNASAVGGSPPTSASTVGGLLSNLRRQGGGTRLLAINETQPVNAACC
ncbi:hypothetical protein OsI_23152 [Oryza sativa Indica Group]|uniref:Uncharacterized protein n=1 Tax=Oryza sativa subsp. indica TaxID=39946 RepID=A2YDG4_ORYSI|nr:hypothetical protein OsI_23152 [Oryza sativa Indica Group]